MHFGHIMLQYNPATEKSYKAKLTEGDHQAEEKYLIGWQILQRGLTNHQQNFSDLPSTIIKSLYSGFQDTREFRKMRKPTHSG